MHGGSWPLQPRPPANPPAGAAWVTPPTNLPPPFPPARCLSGPQDTRSRSLIVRAYYSSRIFMGFCCICCEVRRQLEREPAA